MQILIVDDSKVSRRTLRELVESFGYSVIAEAINGKDGIKKFKHFKPQLILTDLEMPEMDGLTMLTEISHHNSLVKIIVVTSNINKTKTSQAKINGAYAVLEKPIDESLLKQAIEGVAQCISVN